MASTLPPPGSNRPPGLLAFGSASAGEGSTVRANSVEDLVIACQNGEAGAFDRLVRHTEQPLLRLATAILRDPVAAEDAFVEAMSRVLPRIGELDSPAAFTTYARRAVRNAAVDLRRSRSRRDARTALTHSDQLRRSRPSDFSSVVERVPDRGPGPERAILLAEQHERLNEAVAELKEPGRSVLRAYYREGLTYAEIAANLDMSVTTVKRQLGAARAALAARLCREGEADDA